ncbi:MAG: hypothetical protein AB7D06_08930 [Pedobacter sp.]
MTKEEFLSLLPGIRRAAKKLGYAIGLHGSLARDFDLIAAPWTEDAATPDALAEAVFEAAGGVRWRVWWNHGKPKPHGRKAYAFDWDKSNHENRDYCDLSVMPRYTSPTKE